MTETDDSFRSSISSLSLFPSSNCAESCLDEFLSIVMLLSVTVSVCGTSLSEEDSTVSTGSGSAGVAPALVEISAVSQSCVHENKMS